MAQACIACGRHRVRCDFPGKPTRRGNAKTDAEAESESDSDDLPLGLSSGGDDSGGKVNRKVRPSSRKRIKTTRRDEPDSDADRQSDANQEETDVEDFRPPRTRRQVRRAVAMRSYADAGADAEAGPSRVLEKGKFRGMSHIFLFIFFRLSKWDSKAIENDSDDGDDALVELRQRLSNAEASAAATLLSLDRRDRMYHQLVARVSNLEADNKYLIAKIRKMESGMGDLQEDAEEIAEYLGVRTQRIALFNGVEVEKVARVIREPDLQEEGPLEVEEDIEMSVDVLPHENKSVPEPVSEGAESSIVVQNTIVDIASASASSGFDIVPEATGIQSVGRRMSVSAQASAPTAVGTIEGSGPTSASEHPTTSGDMDMTDVRPITPQVNVIPPTPVTSQEVAIYSPMVLVPSSPFNTDADENRSMPAISTLEQSIPTSTASGSMSTATHPTAPTLVIPPMPPSPPWRLRSRSRSPRPTE